MHDIQLFLVVCSGLFLFSACNARNSSKSAVDDHTATKNLAEIHLFRGVHPGEMQRYGNNDSLAKEKKNSLVVRRCVYKVLSVSSPLVNNPSLVSESWQAELERLDGENSAGLVMFEHYRFYYDANALSSGVVVAGNIIVIEYGKQNDVLSVVSVGEVMQSDKLK